MSIKDFFASHNLDNTLLLGYYGGGNYGDELLLEVLLNLFAGAGTKKVGVAYQRPEVYSTYHHDFGYQVVPGGKMSLLKVLLTSKNIMIGGGGIWGLDVHLNHLLLGPILWFARWCLGKKVYLLGVGYYSSTNRFGHISAFFAARAANVIIARDEESVRNFTRYTPTVSLDTDIAWYLSGIDLSAYQGDVERLEKQLVVTKKTLFITLRQFQSQYKNDYADAAKQVVASNPDKPVIVALLEPKWIDPDGYRRITTWQKQHPAMQIMDFSCNPLALFLFFRKHAYNLVFIGPQFHALITAHLSNVPLAYDNKSRELLRSIYMPATPIQDVTPGHLQTFIEGQYAS